METIDLSDSIPKEITNVTVHRSTIKKDMLDMFSDDAIMSKDLKFSIIGYSGIVEDGVGIGDGKEVISSF